MSCTREDLDKLGRLSVGHALSDVGLPESKGGAGVLLHPDVKEAKSPESEGPAPEKIPVSVGISTVTSTTPLAPAALSSLFLSGPLALALGWARSPPRQM